jgi:membrane protease YdiL (CAAX protease family)
MVVKLSGLFSDRPVRNYCWDIVTLLGFLIGAFSSIWLPGYDQPRYFFGLVLIAMSITAWRYRWTGSRATDKNIILLDYRTTGSTRRNNAFSEWARLCGLTLAGAIILLIACWATGAFHGGRLFGIFDTSFGDWVTVKLPTVAGQQVMLQLILMPTLLRLTRDTKSAVFVGSLVFSLLHFPNPLLMVITFIAGLVWISSYLHSRQLAPILASHFALAVFTAAVCGEYVFNLRVGPSCFDLFPRSVETSEGHLYEFPCCVVGIAERLVQNGDQLIVEGWALDLNHQAAPTRLYLGIHGNYEMIDQVKFERSLVDQWDNAAQSDIVNDLCYSFVATVPISKIDRLINARPNETTIDPDDSNVNEIMIYAANANGRLARLGRMGSITPIGPLSSDHSIVLFPVEVDGGIDRIDWKNESENAYSGEAKIHGWSADLRDCPAPQRLYIEIEGRMQKIELESFRTQRPRLQEFLRISNRVLRIRDVESVPKSTFENCGFRFSIPASGFGSLEKIRCFVVDSSQQLHPISITIPAQNRLAEQISVANNLKSR